MEEIENKPPKYSLVTGEKIKNKSLGKLKKKHKLQGKQDKKDQKKLDKRKQKVDKKLAKQTASIVSTTISSSDIEDSNQKNKINEDVIKEMGLKESQLKEHKQEVLIVRKTEKGRPTSFKRKFLNMLSYALVGLVAVLFGYLSGNFYITNVLNNVDYGAFSEVSLRDDAQSIYQSIIDSGKTLDRISAGELFVAAEYVLNNQENYYATTEGKIQPSIGKTQDIWGYKNKTGNIFECENVSKGMLSLAEYYTYDIDAKTANIFKASKVGETATYPDNPTWVMNYEEYKEEYGTDPYAPCVPYIVSSQTIIEGTEQVVSLGSGRYQISFSLTTDSSVINYVKQVKHMSGLEGYPTFKTINVTAIIDSELRFTLLRYDESYSVMYFGVMATCTGYVENNITY